MQSLEERDYFTDHTILRDPYAYFEAIRARGPVHKLPNSDVLLVTGFEESLEVLKNTDAFSSSIAVQGAGVELPFEVSPLNLPEQIEAHRPKIRGGDLVVTYDDKRHSLSRALLARLFTPSRLKASRAFIAAYSHRLVCDAVTRGECELIQQIATPFVTMVIADLLGVPVEDRQIFMDAIDAGPPPGSLNTSDITPEIYSLVLIGGYFARYVQDRRDNPRADLLSELANANFPDGSKPDVMEIVRLTTFLFGAGQDTSAKLLGNAMRYIVDEPGLQERLRNEPEVIPAFIEEVLRLEGSSKMTSRVARKSTRVGDVDVPAGTRVVVALSAANRDPRRWENPSALILDRPGIREHLAFGRGAHVCAGAPLARVEVRDILETFLAATSNIDLDEEKHGPRGNRTLDYEASFIIRGLSALHLKFTPAPDFAYTPAAIARAQASGAAEKTLAS